VNGPGDRTNKIDIIYHFYPVVSLVIIVVQHAVLLIAYPG
jgi:hypothetical protein